MNITILRDLILKIYFERGYDVANISIDDLIMRDECSLNDASDLKNMIINIEINKKKRKKNKTTY